LCSRQRVGSGDLYVGHDSNTFPVRQRDRVDRARDRHHNHEAIVDALASLDSLHPHPQDPTQATYAAKLVKAESRIDWTMPSAGIDRQVRAFNPVPGAEAILGGESLKVWEAAPAEGAGKPGEIIRAETELVVACGDGALALCVVQRAGGRRMAARDFLRGMRVSRGEVFASAH